MSYHAQDLLTQDGAFYGREFACAVQQSDYFIDAAAPDQKALAVAVARGDVHIVQCFVRVAAAGPGIADKVDNGDGTIDQTKVTDADLLSLTQANWPVVAALYFDPDGNPIGGT
jgi:hypothetical protein